MSESSNSSDRTQQELAPLIEKVRQLRRHMGTVIGLLADRSEQTWDVRAQQEMLRAWQSDCDRIEGAIEASLAALTARAEQAQKEAVTQLSLLLEAKTEIDTLTQAKEAAEAALLTVEAKALKGLHREIALRTEVARLTAYVQQKEQENQQLRDINARATNISERISDRVNMRLREEITLIRKAAQDTSLSDGAVRCIAAGTQPPTEADIEWAKSELAQEKPE